MFIPRILKYAFLNIWRNKFLSFSSIIILSLLFFSINMLFVAKNISDYQIENARSRLSFNLYLKDGFDLTSAQVTRFTTLEEKYPGVKIEYVSKEKGLEAIMEREGEEFISILDNSNPLPNSFIVSNIPLQDFANINLEIKNAQNIFDLGFSNTLVPEYADYEKQYSETEELIGKIITIQNGLYVLIALFIFSINIILYSVLSNCIFHFKDEIYITKLVGGSNYYISLPFAIQGFVYVLVSFVIGAGIFYGSTNVVNRILNEGQNIDVLFGNMQNYLIWTFVILAIFGSLSGFISSKRYIKGLNE